MTTIVVWGVIAVVSAVIGGFLASYKNRDYSSWAAWCFLFPPLVIALLLTPKGTGPARRQPTLDDLDRREDRVI
jgi:uncharacterized membrane protein YfcA